MPKKPTKPRGVPWAHDWVGRPGYLEPIPSYEARQAKNKAYQAARYARKIAERKCAKCEMELPPDYTERTCGHCLAAKALAKFRTEHKLCRRCGIQLPSMAYRRCLPCRKLVGKPSQGKYS